MIKEIPSTFSSLLRLKELHLANNKIEVLPTSLHVITTLVELSIEPNLLLTFPPSNVISRGTKAILSYLKDYSLGTEKWEEVKIITIGDAGAGKVFCSFF